MAPKFPADIATPAYVLDVAALKRNLETVARIRREAGCKVLLATKAWAMPAAFPLMRDTLDGTTASGEYEARLGREEFGKEVHVYAPAYAARRGRAPDVARRPHLLQFARAARALRRHRQGGRRQDRRAHQSRLLERHPRRRALRSVRALLALRHHAGADRRAALGRDRHLPCPRAVREPGGRLGRPHRAGCARVRPLHPPGQGGELRRRSLHQQAGLRRRPS